MRSVLNIRGEFNILNPQYYHHNTICNQGLSLLFNSLLHYDTRAFITHFCFLQNYELSSNPAATTFNDILSKIVPYSFISTSDSSDYIYLSSSISGADKYVQLTITLPPLYAGSGIRYTAAVIFMSGNRDYSRGYDLALNPPVIINSGNYLPYGNESLLAIAPIESPVYSSTVSTLSAQWKLIFNNTNESSTN